MELVPLQMEFVSLFLQTISPIPTRLSIIFLQSHKRIQGTFTIPKFKQSGSVFRKGS